MFLLSLTMIFLSSYFIISALKSRKMYGYLYLLLISFSQIILSFEVLSIFKSISWNNFLICNLLFLVTSLILFCKTGRNFYIPEIKPEISKIINAFKRDKLLMFCGVCFCFYIVFQFITAVFHPISFGDTLNYYFPRTLSWIQNGSFAHFVTSDSRELIMPINFDMLYMMHFLFTGTERGTAIYSFAGFFGTLYVLYNFVKELGFPIRKALWSIFVFSAFSLVIIESVTPCSELTTGGLLLSGIFLFYVSVKHKDRFALFFSSLALAISIGVKTTAIIAIPSVIFLLSVIFIVYRKNIRFYKTLSYFVLFFVFNFLIFSSYNFILNFIEYSNPISSTEQILIHGFRGGFQGWLCNFIKYCFGFLDTSGINTGDFSGLVMNWQSLLLELFNLKDTSYTSPYFNGVFDYNSKILIKSSLLGVLGLFAFVPALFKSLKRIRKENKGILISAFAIALIINICVLSYATVFAQYNNRYIITFVTLSAPVLALSYIKKRGFCKILLCFFIFWYLIVNVYPKNISYNPLKNCEEKNISEKIEKLPNSNIALIVQQTNIPLFYLEKPILNGKKINKLLVENTEESNITEFDYVILSNGRIQSNVVIKKGENKNCDYYDRNQNITNEYNTEPAAMVSCESPFEFFAKNNYRLLYKTDNYGILERK